MKKTKNIIITIESIIIIMLVIVIIRFAPSQNNKKSDTQKVENQEITLKEVTKDIPNFSLTISGAYQGKINREAVQEKNIKLYEFTASVNTGWTRETDTYIGYKLSDILQAFDIDDFATIEFWSTDGIKVMHESYIINDNYYIVFYINDKLINEESPAMLFTPEFRSNYSVPKLYLMEFGYSSQVTSPDNQSTESNTNTTTNDTNNTDEQ